MNLKSKLLKEANKTLGVKHEVRRELSTSTPSNLERLTKSIQTDLTEMKEIQEFVFQKRHRYNELRESILKNLIYIRDHRKDLGISSFEAYLSSEIGVTKGYFYEQVQAYELCVNAGQAELFTEVDYKVLVMISRVKDPQKRARLLGEAKTLSREDVKIAVSRTDPAALPDMSKIGLETAGDQKWTITFPQALTKKQKEELQELLFLKMKDWWGA